jgi:hypothetical protein
VNKNDRFIDSIRDRLTPIENHVIDEFAAGRLGSRDFLRHGARFGMSVPLLGALAGAFGSGLLAASSAAAGKPGGTIRVAVTRPTGAIDPVTIDDQTLVLPQQTGEFLSFSDPGLVLRPVLAESWSANQDGSVWSFKIRKGVKFHNGKAMTADDVVATFDRLSDPKGGSNALSVFGGVRREGRRRSVTTLWNSTSMRRTAISPIWCLPITTTPSSYRSTMLVNMRRRLSAPGRSNWTNSPRMSAFLLFATPTTGGPQLWRTGSSSAFTATSKRSSSHCKAVK